MTPTAAATVFNSRQELTSYLELWRRALPELPQGDPRRSEMQEAIWSAEYVLSQET